MFIERIKGTYIAKTSSGIIIDVGGIGYGVEVTLSTLCTLPPLGSELRLWTHTYVREDIIRLFGFSHYEDRVAFEIMLGLSGVGPKVALAILSTLSVSAIRHAINSSKPQILESVPGVGKRLAEKILLEIRPKLARLHAQADLGIDEPSVRLEARDFEDFIEAGNQGQLDQLEVIFEDIRSALENLGFKDKVIEPLLKTLRSRYTQGEFQDIMRDALRILNKGPEQKSSVKSPPQVTDLGLDQELF